MPLSVSFYLSSALGEALTPVQLFGNDPGNSQYCEKAITITCNGKTTTAIIDDKVNFLCQLNISSLPYPPFTVPGLSLWWP